jgi:hypothetical protein
MCLAPQSSCARLRRRGKAGLPWLVSKDVIGLSESEWCRQRPGFRYVGRSNCEGAVGIAPNCGNPRLPIYYQALEVAQEKFSLHFPEAASILKVMVLLFITLCKLWEQLSQASHTKHHDGLVQQWFQQHSPDICRHGPGALAVLSCLFPHKRPDRVYGLREKKLISIIVQAWGLGCSRRNELRKPEKRRFGPGFCICTRAAVEEGGEHVLSQHWSTMEEVDCILDRLASTCGFSSPQIH